MTQKKFPLNQYSKNRIITKIGEPVKIPNTATGITLCDLSPFNDSVQVSWLEPTNENVDLYNEFRVSSLKTQFTDDSPVEIPDWAVATTLWEPPESSESVVMYLE